MTVAGDFQGRRKVHGFPVGPFNVVWQLRDLTEVETRKFWAHPIDEEPDSRWWMRAVRIWPTWYLAFAVAKRR
jgi:hypothetical protein